MSKEQIQAVFKQFEGSFKLMTMSEYENLKKMRGALSLALKPFKTFFCTEEKQAYVIARVA